MVSFWLWNIVTFAYFSVKDRLLSLLFKNSYLKPPRLLSFTFAVVGVLLSMYFQSEYSHYLAMTPIKGSVVLPPFILLFLVADFVSSICLMFFFLLSSGRDFFNRPYARIFADCFRVVFLYIVFTYFLSSLWSSQLNTQSDSNYFCFKKQLVVDYASFYYQKKRHPNTLSEFTSATYNPVNNSKLVFTRTDGFVGSVRDESGNMLLNALNLSGLERYESNPSGFFESVRDHSLNCSLDYSFH